MPEKPIQIEAPALVLPPADAERPQEPKSPDTTVEEDRHSKGQREINFIWEITQGVIAVSVTAATLYVSASLAVQGDKGQAAFLLLSNAFFLVIGFYFGRTNHARAGGVAGAR